MCTLLYHMCTLSNQNVIQYTHNKINLRYVTDTIYVGKMKYEDYKLFLKKQ